MVMGCEANPFQLLAFQISIIPGDGYMYVNVLMRFKGQILIFPAFGSASHKDVIHQ